MELRFVLLILASAFMHAFYNLLMLRAKGNRAFLTQMFLIAFGCTAIYTLIFREFNPIEVSTLFVIIGAAFFYVLYQVFVAKAYQFGNVSTNYPLTVMSPIFVPIWAGIFLHEKPSLQVIIGILFTVLGAIVIKSHKLHLRSLTTIFNKTEATKGAIYAITASLLYSFGSILDKARIASLSLPFYLFILLSAMTLGMVFYTLIFEKEPIFSKFKSQWWLVIIGGVAMFASFYFFRDALVHLPVTIAVPIRLTSILFGLMFGYFILKEKLTVTNWIGALLIIWGIVLVVVK